MNAPIAPDSGQIKMRTPLARLARVALAIGLAMAIAGAIALVTVVTQKSQVLGDQHIADKPVFADELNFSADEKAMYTLSHLGGARAANALEQIVQRDDKRFIPVLIEMLVANEARPIIVGAGAHRHVFALRKLVGDPALNEQLHESLARQWQEWYATADTGVPDGFTGWKGKLLERFDPRFGEFLKNDLPATIRAPEIQYAGIKLADIPSLDHPKMIPAGQADYLEPDEPVFGIQLNGDARAYPQRIFDWHEMMDDEIGGVPVVLAYCALSGAAIAYDRRASDGKTYTFGTSGLLYRSNKLMYDHETKTLWSHFTGRPVLGSLAAFDMSINALPIVVARWESWRKAHPETTVLDINTGYTRRYSPGAAYGDYYRSNDTPFSFFPNNDILPGKSFVFGIRLQGASKAFAVERVANERVVNDAVGDTSIVLVAPEGIITVDGAAMRGGASRKVVCNAGAAIRAYERAGETFHLGPDGTSLVDNDGKRWETTEAAIVGPQGQSLKRVAGFQSYWFAWSVFNPHTSLYK